MTVPDPKHYWPLVEGSGTQATDIAWGAKMTMSRESWGPGRRTRALRFHAAAGALLVTTSCVDKAPPWTVAMWIQRGADSQSATLLSSKHFALKLEQYGGRHTIGVTRFGHYDLCSTYELPLGEWAHLVFVGTESGLTVFVNGAQQAQFEAPSVSLPLQWVGSTEGYTDFGTFAIEDLKIFYEALGTEQIMELYGQLPRPVTFIEGVVNQYAAVTHICGDQLRLGSTSDSFKLQPGDQVVLVQMGGAAVDRSIAQPGEYGKVTELGCAGRYEWGVVAAVDAATITLQQPIADGRFAPLGGSVQLVRVLYSTEDVNVKQRVEALAWDGDLGGIIAIVTEKTLSLGSYVDASGQGFSGGLADGGLAASTMTSSQQVPEHDSWSAGRKGAGVAEVAAAEDAGRGAIANGGGGGNSFVGGGGGGGHAGPGGHGTSYITESDTGGLGGHELSLGNADCIFMGGGGGGGARSSQPQPGHSGSGGRGGGIVLLRAHCVVGSPESGILASGRSAEAAYDGGGGGGAGGTIALIAHEVRGSLILEARGGAGASNHSYASGDGAGGGGGGGVIRATLPLSSTVLFSVDGGKGGRNANTASDGGAGVVIKDSIGAELANTNVHGPIPESCRHPL